MTRETNEPRGVTRAVVRWFVKRYYSRVDISGEDRVPRTGPVLLCANHANSLIDPVLIGIAARRPVRFMAKAPLFDLPVLGPVMHALGMVPAFRGSDDSTQVRKNLESLDVGANVLMEGQAMGIFPEGKSTDAAHLEQIRSGAARMAMQAFEGGARDLQLVPVGLTYESKDKFRSKVWINVGRPLELASWIAAQEGNERQMRRLLTEAIETRLKEVVVHLDNPDWEPWLNDLEWLAEPPEATIPAAPLRSRKRLADAINYFYQEDQERTIAVANDIKAYAGNVQAAGLEIDSPLLRTHGLKVCARLVWDMLWLIVLFLPALKGWIHHLAPFVVVRGIARRMDQPGRKTIATNRMLVGLPIYALWYGLVAWWMSSYFTVWFTWAWMVTAPFAGIIAVLYWRRSGRAARLLWQQIKMTFQRRQLMELRRQDRALAATLSALSAEYEAIHPREEVRSRRWRKQVVGLIGSAALLLLLLFSLGWLAKYWFSISRSRGRGWTCSTFPRIDWRRRWRRMSGRSCN